MACPRSTRPSLAPSRALLLLLLALLSGCRSERAAFQFQPEARMTVCAKTDDQLPPSDSASAQVSPAVYAAPHEAGKRSGVPAWTHRPTSPVRAAASRPKAAMRPALHKNLLQKQLQKNKAPKNTLADPDDSGYIIAVIILGLLGFSLLFIGIPLLIGAALNISYWTALLVWVGSIAIVVLPLVLPQIIDNISYNLMSEEKQMEKNKRDNERYRNNQR